MDRAGRLAEQAEETVHRHFRQGAMLQTVFSSKEDLGRDALREATRRIRATTEGLANAWRPLVLSGQWGVSALSQTAQQADFAGLSTWSEARICSQIFGVDPSLLGLVQSGTTLTYQNALDREQNLWRDAVRPVVSHIEAALSELLPAGRRVDLDERGLLTGAPRDRADYARRLAQVNRDNPERVYSVDEIRAATGHPPVAASGG